MRRRARPFRPRLAAVMLGAALLACAPPPGRAQQAGPQGGSSTAGVFKPRRDAQNRPITAGGFVDGAPVVFEDASKRSGLGQFVNKSGDKEKRYIVETTSGGVALFDYDNDGWLDVYLVSGATIAAVKGKEAAPKAGLFRNRRDGTFEDVTARAGVGNDRWGMGCAVGDFDNDGWPDLYVTNFGRSRLYRNRGNGAFEDVAERAGVTFGGWATGAAFGDYDRDGRLDLFVAGYIDFDVDNPPAPGPNNTGFSFCQYRGVNVMCGPRGLKGQGDRLYRNRGDGTFEDVSERAGVADKAGYYGFGAAWFDADDDGDLDLAVANDSVPNALYLNRGDGTFEDASLASGFALSENGREQAGMGLAVGDYDNDGRDDLVVTNFSDDYNTLYRSEGAANYSDVSTQAGIAEPTFPFLGWGVGFLDYDNDGLKDLFFANGHVYPEVDKHDWGMTWEQRPLLFRNVDGKRFDLIAPATGSGLAIVRSARGCAFGDLDNDGDVDVVLNNVDAPPSVLLNRGAPGANWLAVKLVGAAPRDAVGAVVTCTAGGRRQRALVLSGGSYLSQSDLRVHFGLGPASRVEKLEVRWPSGAVEQVEVAGVNRILVVEEGGGKGKKPGWRR